MDIVLPTTTIPDGTETVVIGTHKNKGAGHTDMHAIIDGRVLCSGEPETYPAGYVRVSPAAVREHMLPRTCPVCRRAVTDWAGHPEWAPVPTSGVVANPPARKRGTR